jgi:hypothetical protein
MSYREFCQLLQNSEKREWFDRLINFYVEIGKGQNLSRIKDALDKIAILSQPQLLLSFLLYFPFPT